MKKPNASSQEKKRQALAHAQADRIDDALQIYQEICETDPTDAESWYMAGSLCGRLGRVAEAEAPLRKVVSLQPNFALGYLGLGQTLELLGRFGEAEDCYRRAVALKPDLAAGHDGLGRLSQRRGDMAAVIAHHAESVRLNPSGIPAHLAMAKAFLEMGDFDAAAESIGRVLQLDVNNAKAYCELARVRRYQGLFDDALSNIRTSLRLQADNVEAKVIEASILKQIRDYQGALDCLMPILDRYQDYPGVALVYASLSHFTKDYDGAIACLEMLLTKEDLSVRSQIHFNLGQLYDKRGEFVKAFAHYQAGNELLPKTFNIRDWQGHISKIINTFNLEALQLASRASNNSQLPIFIVGMPRSGTTLVEQMLSMYPEVAAAGELPDIGNIAHEFWELLDKTSSGTDLRQLSQEQCDRMAQRYLDMLTGKYPIAQRVTDKMPQNFINLGIIALLFPKARVIHCIRDPLDTCLSCYFQMFPGAHGYANNLADLGAYYRQYQRLMEHWRTVLDIPIFEMKYEDLVRDPEKMGRAMVEFCGLTWDQRCLEFYKSKRSVATASSEQVRRPIYTSSLRRWQHYAEYLDPLKQALSGD